MAMAPFLTLFSQDPHYHETGGFGTDHSFGTGGEVYRVTNLNNEGEGSLRYGLELSGPRLIVFEVGGMINLAEKDLVINNGQVTIAGQTAPYPGITIIKGAVRIKADEVLLQHLTLRPGDGGYSEPVGWEPDGFSAASNQVVFDHCSVSWAVDENMSVARNGNDVTFYRCIIAEGLSESIHGKGEHSCGLLVVFDCKNIASIGSLYAHNFRRHPRLVDGSEVLFANNVVYNYGIYAAHIGANVGAGNPDDPGIADFIGNAYFKGIDGWDDYMLESHQGDFDKNNPPAIGKAYLEDNIGLDRLNGNSLIQHDEYVTILSESGVRPEAFQPMDAYENIGLVLTHAGARPGERSAEDARIVQSLIDGTGSIIDSQDEVGGYPEYDSTARAIDSIPETENERRAWLDSISTSLEAAGDIDLRPLYQFIDEHLSTSVTTPGSLSWQISPNPVSDHIQLSFRLAESKTISIYLVDMMGRKTGLINQHFDPGTYKQRIHLGDHALPEGIYLLLLTDGSKTVSKNLVFSH
jgi:hypothetical protein